ncbi:hypothetical protein [Kineococcus glutinatus]|uniref:Uncharacterized protein n=1 Tax=Kineococcus glutinatus TaxID=1070872 RepID=A0ABP9HIZ7_9ACTN
MPDLTHIQIALILIEVALLLIFAVGMSISGHLREANRLRERQVRAQEQANRIADRAGRSSF